MSNLLSQASLVMIPSGYKEDVVYSPIPTNGNGDLSFTRASNGTRINSAGLVEVCPWNLISNSENFNAATWYQENITPTTGQSDPLGANNAFKFLETSATGEHYFFYLFLALNDGVVTQSIYVKSEGRNQILFGAAGSLNSFIFTFSTETISSVTGFTSTSATNVGNGWYRLTGTFIASSPINLLFVKGYNGGISYAGDTSKGFYAFGGQLNIGSTAKPYFPTTDRLNVPRLTYQNGGGGCPSLLLEKQSTNIATYSEDATQWNKGSNVGSITVTADQTISPDGTQNADKVQYPAVGSGSQYAVLFFPFTASATAYTGSVWLKGENGGEVVWINFTKDGVNYTQTLCTLTTSWQRFTLSSTLTSGADNFQIGVDTRDSAESAKPAQTIYVWGRQLEESSYVTTLIPTTSSTATRVADACSKTGISSLIGQTEGVIFMDFIAQTSIDAQSHIWLGAAPDVMGVYGENYFNFYSVGGVSINGGSFIDGERYKIAFAYKQNDYVAYVNGVLKGTDTSATVPITSALYVNSYVDFTQPQLRKVNQVILFPTRLTNAELASLTTI